MMNKVYLVIESWSSNFENSMNINVFKNLTDAQKLAREKIDSIKNASDYNTELEEDYYYEGYNDGEYAENHTSIYIEEKECE